MERIALFEKALGEAEALQRTYPAVQTLQSVINQLNYLLGLANGSSTDRSRLPEIIIGVQAAREIEPLSQSLAELLYQADGEARRM